ncbi:MAG: histidine kinase [Acidipropionibacterium sp.]|jgi:signal transduction histidine kinase|nr:histidine kinase [Acidipropionibacterium sp.]
MASRNVVDSLTSAPWRFLTGRWAWLPLVYLTASAVLGLALLLVLIPTLLLIPIWALAIGMLERRRTRLLGFAPQRTGHVPVITEERHHWLGIRLAEAATWREALALLVDLVMGIAALFILFFEAISLIVLVGVAGYGLRGPTRIQLIGHLSAMMTPQNWWVTIPIGLVWLCALAYLNAALATAQASALRLLCGARQEELDQNIQRLLRSRRALVEASEAERRRIERDLHDGVQQELIVLGARLGMVGVELEDAAARGVDLSGPLRDLDAAQAQAEHAMSTLRDTVRGIHPSVLTDHGLSTALEELAERQPVPVTLSVEQHEDLPPVVETTAYYFAVEALNNAAKHAHANNIHIHTTITMNTFIISVTDDGCGGATEGAGSGLGGLRERAEALNGQLGISSPAGGPTVIRMDLPLFDDDSHQSRRNGRCAF